MKQGLSFLAATVSCVAIILASATTPAFAAKSPKIKAPKAFKADFTLQVGSNPPEQGLMYFSHGKIREEVTPAGSGARIVTIIDPIAKTTYLIDSADKSFRIVPWDPRSALISEALKGSEKPELVDAKTIDGQECEDFEITPKRPGVTPFHIFVNKSTRFPVQLTTVDPDPAKEIHIKWINLSPGYQAAILFSPPLGYRETK